MRMLRVGEGTGELIKSKNKQGNIIYIPHDFEKGYTTAFGGNRITSLSDHPRKNYGGSTAAGAYQIMGYTWDDNTFKQKRDLYKINTFSEEMQDEFCILLLRFHSGCSELINLIINDNIEKATRDCASRIWASLPEKGDNSRYKFHGNPQPATPMKIVLEHYEMFLKEELSNKSPLHLTKGFLKKLGYNCCTQKKDDSEKFKKKGYDIDKAVEKLNNNARPSSESACAKYVRIAIEAGGLSTEGRPVPAKNYDIFLPKLGFKEVSTINYIPIKGDISVIQSIPGHIHGHICMYNGTQWVSDFKQRDMWGGQAYRNNPPRYNIFRWK